MKYIPNQNIERGVIVFGVERLLRQMRKKAGFSQEVLAHKLNTSQSVISKIESGRKVPDIYTVLNWAEATNAKDLLIAFVCGVDVATVAQTLQSLMQIVSAFIHF